jgi:large subunit ribosomal protein L4
MNNPGQVIELKVINDKGEKQASVAASETLFGRDYNEALVHQVVIAYQANGRQGTRKQKTRAEVRHSTKKPWRQKGTGRARAGMTSSPLWRGGGRTFPNKPDENFTQKLNRKMYRAGMASILSQLVREERLAVVDDFTLDGPKTKSLVQKLKNMKMDDVLIITDSLDDNLYLSSRNLANVQVLEARNADPVSLVHATQVLITRGAVKHLEEALA